MPGASRPRDSLARADLRHAPCPDYTQLGGSRHGVKARSCCGSVLTLPVVDPRVLEREDRKGCIRTAAPGRSARNDAEFPAVRVLVDVRVLRRAQGQVPERAATGVQDLVRALRPGRAADEVPGPQGRLSPGPPKRPLALEDEEHLLVHVVEVVRERGLPRLELGDVVPELPRAELRSHDRVTGLVLGPVRLRVDRLQLVEIDDPRLVLVHATLRSRHSSARSITSGRWSLTGSHCDALPVSARRRADDADASRKTWSAR